MYTTLPWHQHHVCVTRINLSPDASKHLHIERIFHLICDVFSSHLARNKKKASFFQYQLQIHSNVPDIRLCQKAKQKLCSVPACSLNRSNFLLKLSPYNKKFPPPPPPDTRDSKLTS
jgi:hypothetical protein